MHTDRVFFSLQAPLPLPSAGCGSRVQAQSRPQGVSAAAPTCCLPLPAMDQRFGWIRHAALAEQISASWMRIKTGKLSRDQKRHVITREQATRLSLGTGHLTAQQAQGAVSHIALRVRGQGHQCRHCCPRCHQAAPATKPSGQERIAQPTMEHVGAGHSSCAAISGTGAVCPCCDPEACSGGSAAATLAREAWCRGRLDTLRGWT